MERLTKPTIGCFKYDFKELAGKHVPGEFGTYEAFWAYSMLCKNLGEYEDTNLTPEEIEAIKQRNAELEAIREQEDKYTKRLSKDLSIHKKALLGIAKLVSDYGYCTHFAGFTCDKDFPKECPKCIVKYFTQLYRIGEQDGK